MAAYPHPSHATIAPSFDEFRLSWMEIALDALGMCRPLIFVGLALVVVCICITILCAPYKRGRD